MGDKKEQLNLRDGEGGRMGEREGNKTGDWLDPPPPFLPLSLSLSLSLSLCVCGQ